MALLQDLIRQINDPTLRDRILQETDKLMKQKKFGLVFEEHLPECTPLYDVPIRVGSKVALKDAHCFAARTQPQHNRYGYRPACMPGVSGRQLLVIGILAIAGAVRAASEGFPIVVPQCRRKAGFPI